MRTSSKAHAAKPGEARATIIICALLVAMVGLVFCRTLTAGFLNYDDNEYVYEQPQVTNGLTLSGIRWAFTHFHAHNWHPLTTISHMIDCQVYGVQPWGDHLTNVILHAAAAVLLFLALKELTRNVVAGIGNAGRDQQSRLQANLWPSFFVAALFAIHPLRVESVAWISERKDVLSGVFFMLTLWAYARYARADERSAGKYFLVVLFFALGLMCKPTLVTVPFVLLLLDYWPLGRMQSGKSKAESEEREAQVSGFSFQLSAFRRLVVEKIPLLILSAASCVITMFAQRDAFTALEQIPFQPRFANAVVAYLTYLEQTIWPGKLAALYPYPLAGISGSTVVLALILLWIISIGCFLARKQNPFLIVGWLWFLGMLVPMIGLVQVGAQPRADRYTYLSSIGLYILVVWGFVGLSAQFQLKRTAIAAVGLAAITGLSLRAYLQTFYWHDSEILWRHAIETTSKNHVAEDSLGNALFDKGDLDQAIAHYRASIAIKPDFAHAHSNLGNALLRQNHPDEAILELREAVQFDPNYSEAYNNLGGAFMKKGQAGEATRYFEKAIQLNPDYAEAYNNFGVALLETGDVDGAIVQYRKAVSSRPGTAEMQCNLGNAYARKSDWNEAIGAYQEALKLRPAYAKAHNNLGVALKAVGRLDDALQQFSEAVKLNADYAEAQFNFGATLAQLGRRDEAVSHLNEALRLRPDYEEARRGLSALTNTK